MTTNNQCNHTDAIAEEMYKAYTDGKYLCKRQPMVKYADLPDDDKIGWINVAGRALHIIGKHAVEDIKDYLSGKTSSASSWWKKALYWAGVGIAGAVLGGWGMSLSGCGHNVDVTPGRTEVCKDGSCLVLEPGHLSYSQAQPTTDTPPVVQALKK